MYLPSFEEQQKRIPIIQEINQAISSATLKDNLTEAEFNQLLLELERLEMNIMEIQDMAFIGGQDKVDRKCSEIVGDPDNPQSKSPILKNPYSKWHQQKILHWMTFLLLSWIDTPIETERNSC